MEFCQELQGISTFGRPQIKRQINRGYYDFVKKTGVIQDVIDITSEANKESYDSSDAANLAFVYKPELVRHIESGQDEFGDRLFPFPGGFSNLPNIKTPGTPTHYWTRGLHTRAEFVIGTYPIDSASSNIIRVYASMFPTADLSADSDEPLIKEAWQDTLVNYAVWKLFSLYSHQNRAWREKAREHKFYYDEDVESANITMFTESEDQFPEVIDAY